MYQDLKCGNDGNDGNVYCQSVQPPTSKPSTNKCKICYNKECRTPGEQATGGKCFPSNFVDRDTCKEKENSGWECYPGTSSWDDNTNTLRCTLDKKIPPSNNINDTSNGDDIF